MKLVKIEDVRVGQVRKVTAFNSERVKFEVLAIIEAAGIGEYAELDTYADFYDAETKKLLDDAEELTFYEDGTLIGFLGITHEIKDNKLLDIQRTEFEVDDVVIFKDGTQRQYVIIEEQKEHSRIFMNNKSYKCIHETYGDRSLYDFEIKKIGIYGVTHEFVNERLVK